MAGPELGDGGQSEGQDATFELADGAALTNVILGVHCLGSCTLRDVTREDVGEDAATFTGSGATVLVEGGSAAKGTDKVCQDNRLAGGSVTIRDFAVSDFGKALTGAGADDIGLCDIFEGDDTGDEPTKIGSEPDGVTCVAEGVTVE